jgi:Fe-S cluster biogenesis protein NfuA
MNDKIRKEIIDRINTALDKIRPYLISDGGNVEFEELTDTMDVKVRLVGSCGHCPFSMQTLKAGVEQTIKQEIPEINEVIAV